MQCQGPVVAKGLDVEVLRLRMVHDDRRRALLGIDLPVLGELAPDALGFQESEQDLLVAHVRAGRVAE